MFAARGPPPGRPGRLARIFPAQAGLAAHPVEVALQLAFELFELAAPPHRTGVAHAVGGP